MCTSKDSTSSKREEIHDTSAFVQREKASLLQKSNVENNPDITKAKQKNEEEYCQRRMLLPKGTRCKSSETTVR